MNKHIKIAILLGFAMVFSPTAGVLSGVAQAPAVKNPGQYIVETFGSPLSMDPALDYESYGGEFINLVYEGLVNYVGNSANQIEGVLATNWTISPDGLVYNFTLRQNVKFTDGTIFNAYVMKYSLERAIIMNDNVQGAQWMLSSYLKNASTLFSYANANQTQANAYLGVSGIQVYDDYHMSIALDQPYPILFPLAYAIGSAVSPKAVISHAPANYTLNTDNTWGEVNLTQMFKGHAPASITNNFSALLQKLSLPTNATEASGVVPQSGYTTTAEPLWMRTNGVGTGPYKLVSWDDTNNVYTFTKNTNWWNATGFAPDSPTTYIVKSVNSGSTRVFDLQQGAADQIDVPASNYADLVDSNYVPYDGSLQAFVANTFDVTFFGLNMNKTLPSDFIQTDSSSTYASKVSTLKWYSWSNATPSPDNPLTALLFRKAITESFDYNTYIKNVLYGLGERMVGVIPNGMFGHDPNLVTNGYETQFNPDDAKALFTEVGWKGTITFAYNVGNDARKAGCLLLKNAIESMNVGIKVNVREMDWPTYLQATNTKSLPMFYLGWAPDFADPDDYATPFYSSVAGVYTSKINYANPTIDTELATAATLQNNATRTALYQQIEQQGAQDFPYLMVYQAHRLFMVKNWVQNFIASGSINPMLSAHAKPQFINKVATPLYTYTHPITTTSNSNAITSNAPGFELITSILAIVPVTIIIRKRKNI